MVSLPDLPPGTVLHLARGDWKYGTWPLLLRVQTVRADLARYYDNEWVWIVGQQLAGDGTPLARCEALVRVAAIEPAVQQRSTATPATEPGRKPPEHPA